MALTNPPACPRATENKKGGRALCPRLCPGSSLPPLGVPFPQGKPKAPQHPSHKPNSLPGTQLGKDRCQGLLDTQKPP